MAHEQKTHKKTFDYTLVYYPDEKSHVPPKMMFTQVKTYLQKMIQKFPLTLNFF